MKLKKLKFAQMKTWSRNLFSTCHYKSGLDVKYELNFSSHKKVISGPELIGWRRTNDDDSSDSQTSKRLPKRSMSLSPGWKMRGGCQGSEWSLDCDLEDEVELFLEKYVLPLQESCSDLSQVETSEYDSGREENNFKIQYISSIPGLHSIDTNSSKSVEKKSRKRNKTRDNPEDQTRKLVTIVNINGDITSFKTVLKKYPQTKNAKIARSKTLPAQSSLYKNSLKVTVNGTGCLDFKEQF